MTSPPNNRSVLVFAEYGSVNGGENSFLSVARLLQKNGWSLDVAVAEDSEFANLCRDCDFDIVDFSFNDSTGIRLTQEQLRHRAAEIIRDRNPGLIHCNSLSTSRLFGTVSQSLSIPCLGYLRDIVKLSRKAISDINACDQIVAVSNATKSFHVARGILESKTDTIYNGADLDKFFPPIPSPGDFEPAQHRPLHCLFVGQIGIRKGIDTLLEAVELFAATSGPIELDIVGIRHSQKQEAIDYEEQLLQTSKRLNQQQRIHIAWLGRRNDVPDLMRKSDVLVHPARQEPLGRVLLEALATGLPAVATDVGGTQEIYRGLEEYELLCPPDDPPALAERICHVASQPTGKLRRKLRAIAKARFSCEIAAANLEKAYSRLITAKPTSSSPGD